MIDIMSPLFGVVCVAIIIGLFAGRSIAEDVFGFKHSGKAVIGVLTGIVSYFLLSMAGVFGFILIGVMALIFYLFTKDSF